MKKRKKKILDLKYKIILGMFILIVFFIILTFSFNKNLFITSSINNIFYSIFHDLNNENDIIGTNINQELINENEELKKLLNISYSLSNFEVINGVVVSRNPSYWLNDVVVNRGLNDGIEKGMSVVVSEGVVGYVSDVYKTSSKVTLITNSSFNNTSVKINNINLILEYDQNNNMIVYQLDNLNLINVGDDVLTSGLTDKYPAGLTIGYVSSIEENDYGTGKILYISLYYDINSIRYVSFLKRLI